MPCVFVFSSRQMVDRQEGTAPPTKKREKRVRINDAPEVIPEQDSKGRPEEVLRQAEGTAKRHKRDLGSTTILPGGKHKEE
jgi:hypothetical protein